MRGESDPGVARYRPHIIIAEAGKEMALQQAAMDQNCVVQAAAMAGDIKVSPFVLIGKPAMDSVACGRKLRLAWATGVAS